VRVNKILETYIIPLDQRNATHRHTSAR